ncbi:MAG: NAD(P)-dependent oxidoreductase [Thermanaeromonas sp.]|uniref:NAD-dependent epimerase/dehydratase family protein n=1 Tax=Thermanaeromonas sp. TaxID=2003697 RepID=UPI00243A9D33|nr:NAD(P)-dependent oxidoreductase [Thermanaeromonas sp.]MCG0277703.1 NAD(P)-dependent oxidoreductase [Thermanaeromonas sp.]
MQVLIAGGAGDVGKYLVKYFSQQGYQVKVLDKVKEVFKQDEFISTYFKGNLIDKALVKEAVQGVNVIINLAWSFSDDAETIFGEDIQGHINLLEEAKALRSPCFLYTSTATVYGRAVSHPVTENHPCLIEEARKPLYALGKYVAEKLCLIYCREQKLPVTIFRFWWAFGEQIGGRHLRNLIKRALENQPLEMVSGAGGTFVTMADLAEAMRLAMGNPRAAGQIYNVGSLFLTWEEIGAMIIDLTGSRSSVKLIPSDQWEGPAFLNEVWDLSWDKAARELGYRPQRTAAETRAMFIQALKNTIERVKQEQS